MHCSIAGPIHEVGKSKMGLDVRIARFVGRRGIVRGAARWSYVVCSGNDSDGKYVFRAASYRKPPSNLGGGAGDSIALPSDSALFRARCCSSSSSISFITSGRFSFFVLLGRPLRRFCFAMLAWVKKVRDDYSRTLTTAASVSLHRHYCIAQRCE
jgi:hypothetical protein